MAAHAEYASQPFNSLTPTRHGFIYRLRKLPMPAYFATLHCFTHEPGALPDLVRIAFGSSSDRNGYGPIRAGFTDLSDIQRAVAEDRNRATLGGANFLRLGLVSPTYTVVDAHPTKRPRRWLWRPR